MRDGSIGVDNGGSLGGGDGGAVIGGALVISGATKKF